MLARVRRYDAGSFLRMEKTPEGFIQGTARVTRTGVFTYKNADGSLRRELRHPNDVFALASLESMKMIPITNLHPSEKLVNADTAKQLSIGFTGENVIPDGKFVMVPLKITSKDGVAAVDNGRKELSLGYEVELDDTPGTYDGEMYDCVQRNIAYNHLAIVDRGRAGADVRLNMDENDAIEVSDCGIEEDAVLSSEARNNLSDEDFAYVKVINGKKIRKFPIKDKAHVRNALARFSQADIPEADKAAVLAKIKARAKSMGITVSKGDSVVKHKQHSTRSDGMIRLDNGLEYEAAPEVVVAYNELKTKLDTANLTVATVKAEADKLRADADTAKETSKQLQAKVDGIPAAVAAGVKERVTLVSIANDFLDEDKRKTLDGASNTDIKKLVILSRFPEAKLDGVSDEYLQARFDSTIELKGDAGASAAAQRQAAIPRQDGGGTCSPEENRKKMIERMKNASSTDGCGDKKK